MARPRAKVLVVDDDPATRDGLTALLENWGYGASSAADGKAALKLCEKELPHAIVTDLMMPGMNGIEFIEGLREQVRQVAVVMMTGQATIETAVQAIKLGAYDYLTSRSSRRSCAPFLKRASNKSRWRAKPALCAKNWSRRWAPTGD